MELNLQFFGGRGSTGGRGGGGEGYAGGGTKSVEVKFNRTPTGLSVTNPDGTKDLIALSGKRASTPLNADPATKIHSETRREASGAGPSGVDYYVDTRYTQLYKTSKCVYEVDFIGSIGYSGKTQIVSSDVAQKVRKRK